VTELTGTIVPLVTPFAADESFDAPAMGRLIDHVLEEGADGLMPTALTGEGPLLERDEALAVWDVVFDKAAGRVPVIPAVIATTTRRAVELGRGAEERGAAAVMLAPVLPELYAGRAVDDVYIMAANNNPTGTIKAGVRARGVDVGVPRLPGRGVGPEDRERLEQLAEDVAKAEGETEAELSRR